MKLRVYLRETHDMDKKNILHGDVMRKFTICNSRSWKNLSTDYFQEHIRDTTRNFEREL